MCKAELGLSKTGLIIKIGYVFHVLHMIMWKQDIFSHTEGVDISSFLKAPNCFPNSSPIVMGELNVDLTKLHTACNQQVSALLATYA
jgi:hypothetical protein